MSQPIKLDINNMMADIIGARGITPTALEELTPALSKACLLYTSRCV